MNRKDIQNPKQKLQASEERFQSFIANSSEQIWCVEFDEPIPLDLPETEQVEHILEHGYFAEVNHKAAEVYGAPVDEVIGWRFDQFMPRALPSTIPFLQSVIRSGYRLIDVQTVEQANDGSERIMLNNLNGTIVDGHVIRVWGTARDVTEARKIEEAIKLRSTAIETMRDGCFIVDAQAEDMPIVYVNPRFTEITKYSASESLGRNCRFLQGPETSPEVLAEIRDAIARQAPFQGELLNYRKDGKPFWNFLRLTPVFNTDGVLAHYIGIQSDITGRKEHEAAIENQNRALNAEVQSRKKTQQQLEELTDRLIEVREEEKRHLARDLHDDITQRIAALALEAARAAETLSDSPERTLKDLNQLDSQLRDLAADTQELSRQLHPKMLEDLGLRRAIQSECRRFSKHNRLELDVSLDDDDDGDGDVSDEAGLCA